MNKKLYLLRDEQNLPILSIYPGTVGGNKRLRIYGRLDCPSALYYIKQGLYIENRVFFLDTNTAKKAGYRPCAKCLPQEYKKWKNEKA
jgi:methylphosphotriester-DNA--protein-cysteine methyltransferase